MLAWLMAHWIWVLVGVLVLAAVTLLVLVPAWRRWRFRRRMLREQERLRDDLLLRKELAEVARGRVSPEDKVLRTRLEDLRTAFDDGLHRLDAAGRGRMGLPWVLVLGEPGAGKTAALRHSGLAFPADLVDPRQGEAGTETMHWWICERAAYLDLAGSILFARWGNQGNAEWRQFLDLLARRRRALPLDALVLCLPADALLADTAEAAARKSALLAEELGRLHRTLGLLLPTWVVVTKLDRVMGFSHAATGLDAAARDAAFAWTNPAADGTYDRAQLREWFDATAERLERMRALAVTGDGWWDEAAGHRAGRMAELHPLAGQVRNLGEALDRTLAAVFTGSPWSSGGRSLLMGVGLCSALDEGRPLDLEVAAARGCDPESLHAAGAPAPAPRPAFLGGLLAARLPADARRVAYSPGRARRARRPWQIAAGLLAAGAVIGAIGTAIGVSALAERIRPHAVQWSWLDQLSTRAPLAQAALVIPSASPASAAQVVADEAVPASADTNRGQVLTSMWESTERPLPVPLWLRLTAPGDGTLSGDLLADARRGGYRLLFSALLARPLVDAARARLGDGAPGWSPEAHAALVQLLAIELGPGGDGQPLDLAALGRFAVAGDPHEQTDLEVLLASQPVAGCRPDPAAPGWDGDLRNPAAPLAAALGGGTVASGRPLQAGIRSFCREWTGGDPHRGTRLADAAALVQAMARFAAAEEALGAAAATIAGRTQAAWSLAQADEAAAAWNRAWSQLDDAWRALGDAARAAGLGGGQRIEDLITEAAKDYQVRLDGEFNALLDPIARHRSAGRPLTSYAATVDSQLREARDKARRAAVDAANRATAAASGLAPVFADGGRTWGGQDTRMGLLAPIAAELARPEAVAPLAQADEELRRLAARCADLAARAAPKPVDKDAPASPRAQAVAEAARAALDVNLRRRVARQLMAAFREAGDTADAVADAVARLAAPRPPLPRPEVPLAATDAGAAFSPRWHPAAATDHLAALSAVARWALSDPANPAPAPLADASDLARAAQDRRQAAAAYERAFVSYWAETVRDQGLPAPANDWAAFRASAANLEPNQVNNALRLVGDQVLRALAIPLRDEEASRRAQAARLALEDERQGFAGALGAACRAATIAWRALPADPAAARQALLTLPAEALKQSLLAAYDERRTGLAAWWNAFALRGLAALRDECLARARRDREAVLGSYDRFPLRADGAGEALTPEQLRQAAVLLAALAPVPAPAGTAAGALDELSAAMAALRDPLAAAGLGADAARLRGMHQIARALVDDSAAATTTWIPVAPGPEVFRIPVPARGRWTAALTVRYLGVRYDPQRPPVRLQAAADPGGQATVCDGIPASAGDIDLLLYRHADEDSPVGTVRLPGAWAAVRLAIDPESRRDADGTVWAPLSTGGTDPRVLWLGLRFARPLPPAATWAGAAPRP